MVGSWKITFSFWVPAYLRTMILNLQVAHIPLFGCWLLDAPPKTKILGVSHPKKPTYLTACPWWISIQGRNFIPSGKTQCQPRLDKELGEWGGKPSCNLLGPCLPPRSLHVLEVFLMVNNLVLRWPKLLIFHGFWGLIVYIPRTQLTSFFGGDVGLPLYGWSLPKYGSPKCLWHGCPTQFKNNSQNGDLKKHLRNLTAGGPQNNGPWKR